MTSGGIPAQQKVAIITGASQGIGRQAAIALSANGWRLVLTARSSDKLEETQKMCRGIVPYITAGDVCDERTVLLVFEAAKREYGRLDLVFNNAGIALLPTPIEDLSLSKFQEVMSTNITSAFLFTREAFKIFKSQNPQGGRIINNGSVSAITPRANRLPYTTSKHAMTGLTKSTSLDGRAFGIACTQINIGLTRTDMRDRLDEVAMDAKHVADAIVHIASLPNSVTVLEMNIIPTEMPFVGRG